MTHDEIVQNYILSSLHESKDGLSLNQLLEYCDRGIASKVTSQEVINAVMELKKAGHITSAPTEGRSISYHIVPAAEKHIKYVQWDKQADGSYKKIG